MTYVVIVMSFQTSSINCGLIMHTWFGITLISYGVSLVMAKSWMMIMIMVVTVDEIILLSCSVVVVMMVVRIAVKIFAAMKQEIYYKHVFLN